MTLPIAVLYEDSRGKVHKQFPLHKLLENTARDFAGLEQDYSPLADDIPKNGDSKLLHACKLEVPLMKHRHKMAIFDADKLHRLLGEPGNVPRAQLLETLQRQVLEAHNLENFQLRIFLLEDNVESLIAAAARRMKMDVPPKDIIERYRILRKAAWDRETRDMLARDVPSFGVIAKHLASLI